MRKQLGSFVRWFITWPILVILALNIENAAGSAGVATIINQHWKDAFPMLNEIYQFATSPLVLYPALIIFGAIFYEWAAYTLQRADKHGSKFQRWLITTNADTLSSAFLRNGLYRKAIKADQELPKMNLRLLAFDMPTLPENFQNDERINSIYGTYLLILAKGNFHHAKSFIAGQDLSPQLPLGTESETQP